MKPCWPSRSFTAMPAGTMIASTSRVKVTGSLSDRYTVTPGRSSLGGNGLGFAVQRGVERVPAEARALHAGREFAHAGERRELAELGGIGGRVVLREQVVHAAEQPLGLGHGASLDALGEKRRRGDRDRAAAALERDV